MPIRFLSAALLLAVFLSAFLAVTRSGAGPRPARPRAPMPQAGLLAYYPFDGDAADRSGGGHDGVVIGARPTTNRHEVAGAALTFDGVDDYVQIPPTKSLEAFSISLWARGKALPTVGLFDQGMHKTVVGHDAEGRILFGVILLDRSLYSVIGPKAPSAWTHIVGTYLAGETLRLYVNDVLVDSLHAPPLLECTSTEYGSSIGAALGGAIGFYEGELDDVRVYDRLLTPAEIHLLFRE